MGRRGITVAIHFDQAELGGVLKVLKHIETGDAGLVHAVLRILKRRGLESVSGALFAVNKDMDSKQVVAPGLGSTSGQSSWDVPLLKGGKQLEYLTAFLGSAIMSATVSLQVA